MVRACMCVYLCDSSMHSSHSCANVLLVLKETLDARGSLNQIKARIRAEIFAALDDQVATLPWSLTARRVSDTRCD